MNSYHCANWETGPDPLTWCRQSPIVFSCPKTKPICSTLLCNLCPNSATKWTLIGAWFMITWKHNVARLLKISGIKLRRFITLTSTILATEYN